MRKENICKAGVFCAAMLIGIWIPLLAQEPARSGPAQLALDHVAAERMADPLLLELAGFGRRQLTVTGKVIYRGNVLDHSDGSVTPVSVDPAGRVVNWVELIAAEKRARADKFGSLTPDLARHLDQTPINQTVDVGVWLRVPGGIVPFERPAKGSQPRARTREDKTARQAENRALRRAASDHLASQVRPINTAFELHITEGLGGEVLYSSPVAPLVYVRLSIAAVRTLSERDDVDTVYAPHFNQDLMSSAKTSQKGHLGDQWGFSGTGVDVAIVEDSRIEFSNPYLNVGPTRIPLSPNVDIHATATAGIVASQHAVEQGISVGANLYSANGTSYDSASMAIAMDWAAATQNVDIMNNSWGSVAGTDRKSRLKECTHSGLWNHSRVPRGAWGAR